VSWAAGQAYDRGNIAFRSGDYYFKTGPTAVATLDNAPLGAEGGDWRFWHT
jgi:hypothetical protein